MTRGQKAIAAQTKREIREGRAAAKRLAAARAARAKKPPADKIIHTDHEYVCSKCSHIEAWPPPMIDDPNIRLPDPVRRQVDQANGYYKTPPRPFSLMEKVQASYFMVAVFGVGAAVGWAVSLLVLH